MYQPHPGSSSDHAEQVQRLFIALPVSTAQRAWLVARRREAAARPLGRRVRWVEEHNLHLTLRFLGDTPGTARDELRTALARTAEASAAPLLQLTAPLLLPSMARPRVVAVGVAPAAPLRELAALLDAELAAYGWAARTRPLVPHVTLARPGRGRPHPALRHLLPARWPEPPPQDHAPALQLISSTLTPQGPLYTVSDEFRFARRVTADAQGTAGSTE